MRDQSTKYRQETDLTQRPYSKDYQPTYVDSFPVAQKVFLGVAGLILAANIYIGYHAPTGFYSIENILQGKKEIAVQVFSVLIPLVVSEALKMFKRRIDPK